MDSIDELMADYAVAFVYDLPEINQTNTTFPVDELGALDVAMRAANFANTHGLDTSDAYKEAYEAIQEYRYS